MKKTDFTQQGGFPLEEKTLNYMQTAYLQILTAFVGHLNLPNNGSYIISGCEISGTNITSGMMYINGELCPFNQIEGNANTKIAKIETIEEAPFESGDNLETYFDYTAQENENGVAYHEFHRVPNVPEMVNQAVNWNEIQGIPQVVIDPANAQANPPQLTVLQRLELLEAKNAVFQTGGGMVLWNKPANQIPAGWAEVVNWRGRMPVGVDPTIFNSNFLNPEFAPLTTGQNDPGRTGGAKSRAINKTNLPAVKIKVLPAGFRYGQNGATPGAFFGSSGDSYDVGGSGYAETENLGDGTPLETLNPYRTVLFIEWVGLN